MGGTEPKAVVAAGEEALAHLLLINQENKKNKMKMADKQKPKARKRAESFYTKHFPDGDATPKRIADKLYELAGEMRPRSWYELKRFVMFDQHEKGYQKSVERLQGLSNPMTDKEVGQMLKPAQELKKSQKRVKKIKEADHLKLMRSAINKKDKPLAAALYLAKELGCRPAEMPKIEIRDGKVWIPSVKKVEAGDKGIDRLVTVSEEKIAVIKTAVDAINSEPDGKSGRMHRIANRLQTLHKKTFPRRKSAPISLYSYRHQLGSDLKASGMTREAVAYVMGHQSTQSVEDYGDVRNGGGRDIKPAIEADKISDLVRSNHNVPPSDPSFVSKAEQRQQAERTASSDSSLDY